MPGPSPALADFAAAFEALRVIVTMPLPDQAAAADQISGQTAYPADQAGGIESLFTGPAHLDAAGAVDDAEGSLVVTISLTTPAADAGSAADLLAVTRGTAPAPAAGPAALRASPAFVRSAMPRMHLQNLITGAWLHRDVQGITSPQITWSLNAPDTFTCTLGPPRPDLLDATGNPVAQEWRDACYLEENDEIKFGGILTSSTFAGPSWQATFTGFTGFPSGIPYEGPDYVKTRIDALDVVRDMWEWLQEQPHSHLGMVPDSVKAGMLLGAQVPAGATSTLDGGIKAGVTVIKVHNAAPFNAKMRVSIMGGSTHVIKSTSTSPDTITLTTATGSSHKDGDTIAQVVDPTPFSLYWYNSTDIGQEITSIQGDAVFDMWETHQWTGPDRTGVKHRLRFGVPRSGRRQASLRFAEGENIVAPVQGTRDGTQFANDVVGMGSGQGKRQIRASVSTPDGHLRRVLVYTDQTVKDHARMSSKVQRILTSRLAIDTPATVMVINHPNAPFGSFVPGDDIYIRWVTGWRNVGIWARITAMTQDPTTSLMNLTLARSDSFTYLAQSGQAGTL